MFDQTDPRAALAGVAPSAAPAPTRFAPPAYARFYETPPQATEAYGRHWYARGQNFMVAYTEADVGAVLARADQPDEYAVLLPDAGMQVAVHVAGARHVLDGNSLAFIPPGESRIEVLRAGRIVRILTTRAVDLAARCSNAESYAVPHPNLPEFRPWPTPPGGLVFHAYSLEVPRDPTRFGRIWRCTTLMVNVLDPADGPRDRTKMSPHHHDDFEQGSLVLDGAYTHHLRWPWTVDMTIWREDEHAHCGAPSLTVIPPPSIHTSEATEAGQMVDLFCPPRLDFSARPGWVLNAADYPLP